MSKPCSLNCAYVMLAELQFLNSNPIVFPLPPFVGLRAWGLGIMGCELCGISFEIQGAGASGLRFRNLGHRVEGIRYRVECFACGV